MRSFEVHYLPVTELKISNLYIDELIPGLNKEPFFRTFVPRFRSSSQF